MNRHNLAALAEFGDRIRTDTQLRLVLILTAINYLLIGLFIGVLVAS